MSVLVAQPCPTFCNPMDCSPPGSSVHGISQAKEKKDLKKPTEQNIQELWNNLKSAMGLAGKERETGTEAIYEQ